MRTPAAARLSRRNLRALAFVAACLAAQVWAWPVGAETLVETRVKFLGSDQPMGDYNHVAVSPNGERLACIVTAVGMKSWVLCDGQKGPVYDRVGLPGAWPAFSSDGERLAYMATRAGRGSVVVCDDEETPCVDWGRFAFSPDGKHIAFIGRPTDRTIGMMQDGKLLRARSPMGPPVFSPDSRRLAFRSRPRSGEQCVVCDEKPGAAYEKVELPAFSADSRQIAYAALRGGTWTVVVGAAARGSYDEVTDIGFSPDGKVACRTRTGKKWRVVRGDRKEPEFDDVSRPVFSRDGKHFAYAAKEGDEWLVVRDGKKEGTRGKTIDNLVFSPDGARLACVVARDGKESVACDGKEGTAFDKITWVGFSSDGAHLLYAAALDYGIRSVFVCDGVAGPVHQHVLVPERVGATPGKARYVVVDTVGKPEDMKGDAWLVEADLPARP